MLGLIALLGIGGAVPERILAVDNFVVAHTVGGRWRAAEEGFAKGRGPMTFRSFGVGTASGVAERVGFEFSPEQSGTYLKREDMRPLLAGGMPRAPRRVSEEKPSATYEAICRGFLTAHGIKVAKARVTRVLRVDLDGDGTDETIVEAGLGERTWHTPKGTYSLVLLRALRGGRVVQTALEFTPERPDGSLYEAKVKAVADLDGDGRMEVLTTAWGHEDNGARLWGYASGRATMLVENGIGV